ncbi:beta-1,3-galactosyl-O-glycosyl-glycoprotein beta-1,6-N-acetylglucosaminyltransferase 3-like [Glandiceps talaboti]
MEVFWMVTVSVLLVICFVWSKQEKTNSNFIAYASADYQDIYNRRLMAQFITKENVTCTELRTGKYSESVVEGVERTKSELDNDILPDKAFLYFTRNCSKFAASRGYLKKPVTEEEKEFPLAFGIIMHESANQAEKLLRTIYRPHNVYCIHVDSKSPQILLEAMMAISDCFDNVFIASKLERVVWSSVGQVMAELNCQEDALEKNKKWKYFINLTGQEFPLKTNLEIVQILKEFRGQNDISMSGRLFSIRTDYKYHISYNTIKRTRMKKTQLLPKNMKIHKGDLHSALTRGFVEFLHSQDIAKQWLEWVKDIKNPDEIYYQSLAYLPEAPGGPGPRNASHTVSRAKIWKRLGLPCYGTFVRDICIFSWKDLPWLDGQPHLFANKFKETFDPLALKCLEEEINRRTFQSVTLNFDIYDKFVQSRSWYGIGPVYQHWRTDVER